MRTPKQYWLQLSAHLKNIFQLRSDYPPEPGEPECSIAELRNSIQTLAEELQYLRGKYEAARTDNNRLVDTFDGLRQATETARTKNQGKFAALERWLGELQSRQSQSHDQMMEMETVLNETGARVEATDRQAAALQHRMDEQARTIETCQSETTALLKTMGCQIVELADKSRFYLQMEQETRAGLQSQGRRLVWTSMLAAMVIVLATLSGVILVRDVQKNAQLLVRMDSDMKQLIVSMVQHPGLKYSPLVQGSFSTDAVTSDVATAQGATTRDGMGVLSESQGFAEAADSVASDSDTLEFQSGGTPAAVQVMSGHRPMPSGIQDTTAFTEEAVSQDLVSTGGDLHYEIVTPGTGRSPEITDRVIVNYLGVTPDGKVIDDTYSTGRPAKFPMSKMPPAMQEVLLKMEEGAEWEVYVQEEQRDSGTFTRRGAQETGPIMYLIELVEVIRDTPHAMLPSIK